MAGEAQYLMQKFPKQANCWIAASCHVILEMRQCNISRASQGASFNCASWRQANKVSLDGLNRCVRTIFRTGYDDDCDDLKSLLQNTQQQMQQAWHLIKSANKHNTAVELSMREETMRSDGDCRDREINRMSSFAVNWSSWSASLISLVQTLGLVYFCILNSQMVIFHVRKRCSKLSMSKGKSVAKTSSCEIPASQ